MSLPCDMVEEYSPIILYHKIILKSIKKGRIEDLIKITKDEAIMLRKQLPNVYIVTVGKFAPARKKTRFVEETKQVLNLVRSYRKFNYKEVYSYGK